MANHAGTIPVDALITSLAVRDNHPNERYLRVLAADMAFETPVVSDLAEFKARADLIIANRMSPDLADVADKVFTRDLFGGD